VCIIVCVCARMCVLTGVMNRRKTTKKLVGDSTQSSGDMSAASSASEAG